MAQFGPPENATLQNIGADGARWSIAWQQTAARQPGAAGAIWLSGLMSDMASGKASHLANWAETAGIAFTRFDFRGHGQSGGRFEEAAASDWLSDARLVLEQVTTGPQVLVGSSMGGWIALLLARAMIAAGGASAGRIAGIVLIAPAWDMTERLMWAEATPEQRRAIETVGVWQPPSAYGDTPYPITRRLIDDGRTLCLAGRPLDIGVPTRIIHGMRDTDVPWQGSVELSGMLSGDDVRLTLVKDGEHRLSRPQDLDLLTNTLAELVGV